MKLLISILTLSLIIISCESTEEIDKSHLEFDGISENIRPGDNFFAHVNQSWYDQAVIADDEAGVGSYSFLNIPQKKLLQSILEEVASGAYPQGSTDQLVGDFYSSGMDTATINNRGFSPILPLLEQIDQISSVQEVMAFVIEETKSGNSSLVNMYVSPDHKNSRVNILHFSQAGLGLPDRDYYFKRDESTIEIQESYKNLLLKLFKLSEQSKAENLVIKAYKLEKELAQSHKTRVEKRDIKANYHKMAVADLDQSQPNIAWSNLLSHIGTEVDSIDIRQPAYYEKLNELLTTVPIENWRAYLKANILTQYADILSRPFEEATFNYSKVLSGQSTQKSRSQRMVQKVDRQLGYALGKLYVERHFDEEAKKRVLDLVNNLQKAFEKRMDDLDWMSDNTKVKAKEKLYAITKKIGYPDVWREYGDIIIQKDAYFENVISLRQEDFGYELAKLKQAPDKTEWHTTPPTVTAYYNPSMNEIVFPAGILQFPYFHPDADDAINYGGIGMVIGHELTHAFDDQGAQYDKDGNVNNWWAEEDYTKFKEKTQQIIDQYNAYTVLDSIHIKGALTVGENTADNGGIAIAYDAFKMTAQGQDSTKINGYTPDQRFFMSLARIWRVKTRNEYLRNYVKNNSHSPPIWRVNGPTSNLTPFYKAFGVQEGDQHYKPMEKRVHIW